MENMNLIAKAKQSQEKLDELMADIFTKNHGTGTAGWQYEKTVCQLASANGITSELIAAAGKIDLIVYIPNAILPEGLRTKATGRRMFRIEIKTGCGIVAQLEPKFGDSIENYSEADLLPKADLIIYAPRASEFDDIDDLLDESLVLTIPEWARFMIENSGKRKHDFGTAFKLSVNSGRLRELNDATPARPVIDKKGNPVLEEDGTPKMTKRGLPRWTDCIVIQEAYRQQIIEAVQANVETRQYKTLGEWLEEIGRA